MKAKWLAPFVMLIALMGNKTRKLKNDLNAFAGLTALAGILITIIITAVIYYSISAGVTLNSTAYNTTKAAVDTMAGTVFGLWILVPLVVIGMFLIGIMVGRTAGKKGGL